METTKRLHPLLTAAAVSLIVFSAVGIAALTGALPLSRGSSEPVIAPEVQKPIEDTVTMPAPAAKHKPRPIARAVAPRSALPGVAGVIESVKEIERPGDAKGIGAVGGGIAGAVIGHNIGDHNKLVTVLGSAGGALLGHHIEKTARATKLWETTVRLDDGSTKTISSESQPLWQAGERVRVVDGQIQKS